MAAVQPLRLAQFIQSKTVNDNLRFFRQIHRFFFQDILRISIPFISPADSNHRELGITDYTFHGLHLNWIHHGGPRPLIPRLHGKISDDGHLRSSLQRKEFFLIL